MLYRLLLWLTGCRSMDAATLEVHRQTVRTQPEMVGGSYCGHSFLPPEDVGGNEVTLPANDRGDLEFYRYDGRVWRFVKYCRAAVVRISE